MPQPTEEPERCELCGRKLAPHEHYVVRIDVFADPSLPGVSAEQVAGMDFDATMAELLAQMEHLSADDLMDHVHRRFEYGICAKCQPGFLANPMGKPREMREGEN